jgi:UDP-glucose 4-epimerase
VAPRRAGDPAVLVADPSRAMSLLDWKPIVSDLETIVRTAWSWHERRSGPGV